VPGVGRCRHPSMALGWPATWLPAGVPVAEVIRPNRQARRQRGKSDAARCGGCRALDGSRAGR
jgi:hypothetical protein